jgi:hypothetical protein
MGRHMSLPLEQAQSNHSDRHRLTVGDPTIRMNMRHTSSVRREQLTNLLAEAEFNQRRAIELKEQVKGR